MTSDHPAFSQRLLLTGGSGGLGQAVLTEFRGDAWEICAPTRDEVDVCDREAIRAFFHGRSIDLLICAAGAIADAPLARFSEPTWNETVAVNFQGAADCAAAALPAMLAQQSGHIVFISSYSAVHPPIGQAAYATAKAALIGLTEELARLHGHRGVRVNAILPGFLETRMTESVTTRRKAAILASHALGRFNTPSVVAGFIRHLHDRLPHTSGQVFQLDSRVR